MSDKPAESSTPEAATPAPPADHLVITRHSILVGGTSLAYTVTTGTLVLKEEAEKKQGDDAGASEGEKPRATVFFVAYALDPAPEPAARPVTFSFNGGPGSSSVWLHLGVLGPRRVVAGDAGDAVPPPYRLTDNAYTLLAASDLVFIDPVSTGFSRAVTGEKAKEFHNFKKDIESVGDFIRLWTTRYRRWASPKFLIGESYGTTRAAGLAGYLQERHGMYLNGLMLVSCALDFATLEFTPTNDLPYIVYLPTYAATAWYHQRLAPELQKDLAATLAEAAAFARGDYAAALFRGASLPSAERAAIAARVARYTGLSADWVDRANLRVEIGRFCRELLRSERKVVGRLDSRFTGVERDAVGEAMTRDPSIDAILGPFAATLNDYVRGELGFESDAPYEILNFKANEAWRFPEHENRYVEVAETLRQAMTLNPHLKVFVANGWYDLATPHMATEHTFDHLGLDPARAADVTMAYYEAGHMMYVHAPSLARMHADLERFVRSATPGA